MLDWADVTTATAYEVYKSTNGVDFTAVSAGEGGTPATSTATVASLTAATDYWFKVRGTIGAEKGPWSAVVGPIKTAAS